MRKTNTAAPSYKDTASNFAGSSGFLLRHRYAQFFARAVFVAIVLSLALYACGGKTTPPKAPPVQQVSSQPPPPPQQTVSPPPPLDSNGTYSETEIGASATPSKQSATGRIMLPGLPYGDQDAEHNDLKATACIEAKDHMGKSMQDLQHILHKMIQKKLVQAALSGSTDNGSTPQPSQHIDDTLLSGLTIDKEGYYNGEKFGELCVDAEGKLSQALMAQYRIKRISITNFCYSNPKYADNLLRPYAMTAALKQLATHQDPRLGDLSFSEIRDFLSRITVSNEKFNSRNHQLCLDIVADYNPMQARRTLQTAVLEQTMEETPPPKDVLHLAHYSLYLDLTPYHVGQPMPDFGEAISISEGQQGKALSLTGTTAGWCVFTSLNQEGKDVPSSLENQGKPPAKEDLFAFQDHPIGDFNATIKIGYNNIARGGLPLNRELFVIEYRNYVTQGVHMTLTKDKDNLKYVSFDLEHTRTDPIPFTWGDGPVTFTLQKQNAVFKLFMGHQFIISIPSQVSPLYSISANMMNGDMLFELQVEGDQIRPQPQPPKGVAGMIPYSTKWEIPPQAGQPAASESGEQPMKQPDGTGSSSGNTSGNVSGNTQSGAQTPASQGAGK